MQRSGSQTVLLVLSVLSIIGAVLLFFGAASFFTLSGFVGGMSPAEYATAGVDISQGKMAEVMVLVGVILIIDAIWELLCGIFGIRGAKDPAKVGAAWGLCLVGLILEIIGIFVSLANGQFQWGMLISLILYIFMIWIINNIKHQKCL